MSVRRAKMDPPQAHLITVAYLPVHPTVWFAFENSSILYKFCLLQLYVCKRLLLYTPQR